MSGMVALISYLTFARQAKMLFGKLAISLPESIFLARHELHDEREFENNPYSFSASCIGSSLSQEAMVLRIQCKRNAKIQAVCFTFLSVELQRLSSL
ncbi:MAG: hypothetical protein P8X96_21680 [Desulfobacteraceae bacterium]